MRVFNLAPRYRELQKSIHPDKYINASATEKRLSMQWAAQLNGAFDTLKAPLPRAIYLLGLNEVTISDNPTLDPAFLMEQIELREELEEIEQMKEPLAKLDEFKDRVTQVMSTLQSSFASSYDGDELGKAEQEVYKLQFLNKLYIAADHLEEKLLDY